MDLSSLNMENIENILSSMSSEDMEKLSDMAQSIFSSFEQNESNKEKSPPPNNSPFSSFNLDFETLGKIMSVMERISNRPDDPRYNLLLSLKPMLSKQKQGKIDEALKIVSLLSLLPIIDELKGDI